MISVEEKIRQEVSKKVSKKVSKQAEAKGMARGKKITEVKTIKTFKLFRSGMTPEPVPKKLDCQLSMLNGHQTK
jgi:hypothetical protein